MSWDAWCEGIIAGGRLEKATLFGLDLAKWGAGSSGEITFSTYKYKTVDEKDGTTPVEVDIDEKAVLLAALSNIDKATGGLWLLGKKFQFFRNVDSGTQDGSGDAMLLKSGQQTAIVFKTKKAVIVAVSADKSDNPPTFPHLCMEHVAAMGNKLIASGF